MIFVDEYPYFDVRNMINLPHKAEIIKTIIDDLFSHDYEFLTTSDIDKYVEAVNCRLYTHYQKFFDKHDYKFEAKYSDNNLNLDLYRDGELYELYSLLDTIADNIKAEWKKYETNNS